MAKTHTRALIGLFAALSISIGSGSAVPAQEQEIGQVTQLPLPRYVSVKTNEANARRGPGKSHRIDWRFVQRGLPLKVVGEHGHWRQVEDHEGMGGWIHYALLSRQRTVLVVAEDAELFERPAGVSRLVARLAPGVVGTYVGCERNMCEIEVADAKEQTYKGWVRRDALWGLGETE